LAGEGLQHLDGHSHVLASTVPTCRAYDPTYAYELAVIVHDGMRRMYVEQEAAFYYITVTNEQYVMPDLPKGAEEGIVKGMYLLRPGAEGKLRVQLLGSGAILREVLAAAESLASDFGVQADVWSVTSFGELRREGEAVRRENLLHPGRAPVQSYVERVLAGHAGPVVAASDYIKLHADQIRPFVSRPYTTLGTDGFGRSDTREGLRRFFEVDRGFVVVAALRALCDEGAVPAALVQQAIEKYGIDPDKRDPARS
jgi:pyruvate dehydrogenase E1 component